MYEIIQQLLITLKEQMSSPITSLHMQMMINILQMHLKPCQEYIHIFKCTIRTDDFSLVRSLPCCVIYLFGKQMRVLIALNILVAL